MVAPDEPGGQPDTDTAPGVGESPGGEPAPQDTPKGQCVDFYMYADGTYGVGEPEPIDAEDSGEDVEKIPDLSTALKHLIKVVKDASASGSDEENFQAGYSGASGEARQAGGGQAAGAPAV